MADRDPNIVTSSLSGPITREGITVEVHIIRLEHDPRWALEVVNERGTSTTWDDLFDTDDAAFEMFERTVQKEGMVAFLDHVIPFPKRN